MLAGSLTRSLTISVLLLTAAPAPAQQGGDIQAQILYAYQTEDGNSLANLIQDLAAQVKTDAGDASLRYHLAHAQYRRGLLGGATEAGAAEAAFASGDSRGLSSSMQSANAASAAPASVALPSNPRRYCACAR